MVFCLNSSLLAYNIYLKSTGVATELKIDVPIKNVDKIIKNNNSILIKFNRIVEITVSKDFKSNHIKDIDFKNNELEVKLYNSTSYFIRKLDNSIIITVTPDKKLNDIFLSNNIEKPLINRGENIEKNPVAEKQLNDINNLLKKGDAEAALSIAKQMLEQYKSGYYASEALFRLGMIYMEMGKKSDKYYLEASFVFDNFIKQFPENFRLVDALWQSAEAKEKAGIYYESIFTYRKVLNIVPDTATGRQALINIGDIYYKIGQFNKAIDTYKEYIKKFKERPGDILAKLGLVYYKLKDNENAYLYFNEVANKGIDYLRYNTDVLLAMAQTFEDKKRFKDAIEIYNKIYNLYPNSDSADIAMYKSGVLLEKEGKTKLSRQLLLECKEKYKGKKGALMAALYLAKKDMSKFSSEYWLTFLNDVLENNIDINLKIDAHYFIIKSYFREGRYKICLQLIKEFENKFFDSPLLEDVYTLKQQIYLKQAHEAFLSAQLDKADAIAKNLLKEFPNSKFKKDIEHLLENTKFYRINKMYKNKKYLDVIHNIEEFYTNTKNVFEKEKWNKLLEEAYMAYINKLEKAGETKVAMLYARQYLIQMPNGNKFDEIRGKLVKYISDEVIRLVKDKSYIKAVQIYERDKSWLEKSKNFKAYEEAKSYIAFALYKLGEKESAIKLIKTIKNKNEPKISMLMLLLDLNIKNFDVNRLSDEDFKFVITELKYKNPDKALRYIDKYKKNDKLKYILKYDVINSLNREDASKLLENLYFGVLKKPEEIQKAVKNLFFDVGLNYYKQEKYSNAVKAFEKYIKLSDKSDKFVSKSIYFSGKSYVKLKNFDKAITLFNRIIKEFPNSEYVDEAKAELKDLNWEKITKK